MKNFPPLYEASLHDEDYRLRYSNELITADGLICDAGRERESLDGLWSFTVDPYDTCLRAGWIEGISTDDAGNPLPLDYNFDRWEKISVPGCWNLQRERYYYYEGPAVYTRTFELRKETLHRERIFLKFGGVHYEARVFLNGKYLGRHTGGFTPFYVEITDHRLDHNRIVVVVDNARRAERVPALNTDWFNYGGIHRSVEIIRTPSAFIKNFFIYLAPDGTYSRIRAELAMSDGRFRGTALLRIPELGLEQPLIVRDGKASTIFAAAPEPWSPENPRLYEVTVSCGEDIVRERVGFREVRVRGTKVMVNGKDTFFRGVCCHEESLSGGRTRTEEEIRHDLQTAKELGCNFMRLAHYPHSPRAAELADQLGLFLWEEIPVYWAIDFENPVTQWDSENQLRELIQRDRNRASVVVWSVGNENADTDSRLGFMSSLAAAAREADPSRLVSAACLVDKKRLRIADRLAEHLDVIGINEYYGWYEPDYEKLPALLRNSAPDKPVFVTEFGGDARAGNRGRVEDFFTEDRQRLIYEKQRAFLTDADYVRGTSPWILFDFRCPRRTNEFQEGYNRKGLLAEDKKTRKLAYYTLREWYSSLAAEARVPPAV